MHMRMYRIAAEEHCYSIYPALPDCFEYIPSWN